jgi:transcriptional regulator with XRE-family HTH domain
MTVQVFDLKRFRKDKSLTQVDVAKMFSCNQNFISNIESGIKSIPQDKLDILQSKFGDISGYISRRGRDKDGIKGETTSQELLFGETDAFTIVKLMNDKLIAPYAWLEEKDKEIERLNRHIGKLEAQLAASKKVDAQEGGNAICAVAK